MLSHAFEPHPAGAAGTVAVVIPVRNERRRIDAVAAAIAEQTLQPAQVIFVDGASTDGTWRRLLELASTDARITVLANQARTIPVALNMGLAAVRTELVARMDCHVDYPPTYLASLQRFLVDTPSAAGAGMPYSVAGAGRWGRAAAAVLDSRWGNGAAPHQSASGTRPVAHVRWPMYRRCLVEGVGGWRIDLPVNEDEELDHRIGRHGDLWLVVGGEHPRWWVRDTPTGHARRMWDYGFWRARTVRLHPSTLSCRVAAPPLLVVALLAMLRRRPRAALAIVGSQLTVGGAIAASVGEQPLAGALAMSLTHLAYGAGFLVGLLRRPGPRVDGLPTSGD